MSFDNRENVNQLQKEKIFNSLAKKELKKISSTRPILGNILYTEDGCATFTNGHILVKVTEYHDGGREIISGQDGSIFEGSENYPNINRNIPDLSIPKVILSVKELESVLFPIKKTLKNEVICIRFEKDEVTITPVNIHPEFVEAKLSNQPTQLPEGENLEFSMNTNFIYTCINFFKRLKVKNIELHFTSPVHPIAFTSDRSIYVIAPVRTK